MQFAIVFLSIVLGGMGRQVGGGKRFLYVRIFLLFPPIKMHSCVPELLHTRTHQTVNNLAFYAQSTSMVILGQYTLNRLVKVKTKTKNLRSGQSLEQVRESLAVSSVQQSTKGPDEAEEVEALDVQLSADLNVVSQHGRQQSQACAEHSHLTQLQARPVAKQYDNKSKHVPHLVWPVAGEACCR